MKNNERRLKIVISILITIIILLGIEIFLFKDTIITDRTQIIKEMTQSENEASLQTQINTLNASHNEYAKNVENYKKAIAEAITNEGIATSITDSQETVASNIGKIFKTRTTIDEETAATAEDITEGKQAYVNGDLITGNKATNTTSYETLSLSWTGNHTIAVSIDVSSKLKDYKNVKGVYFNNIYNGICNNVRDGYGVGTKYCSYNTSTGVLTIYASATTSSTGYLFWYNGQTYTGDFVFLY